MLKLSLAAVLLVSAPVFAQQTGISTPPDAVVESALPQPAAVPVATPTAVPADALLPAGQPAGSTVSVGAVDTADTSPSVTLKRHDLARFDPDAGIVTAVAHQPNELPAGTVFRVRLKSTIETLTTQPDTFFTAVLAENMQQDGRVIVPAGSVLEGRITGIRGGRRFRGPAMIHLQTQSILLPDGTRMPVHAAVIDTDQYANTRIDSEGNIVRRDHAKETLVAMSLATGSAAAAGGVLGGPAGALIGAGVGAGVSTVWWLKQDRQTELPADTLVVMALTAPVTLEPLVREPDFSTSPAARPASQTELPVGTPTAADLPAIAVPVSSPGSAPASAN